MQYSFPHNLNMTCFSVVGETRTLPQWRSRCSNSKTCSATASAYTVWGVKRDDDRTGYFISLSHALIHTENLVIPYRIFFWIHFQFIPISTHHGRRRVFCLCGLLALITSFSTPQSSTPNYFIFVQLCDIWTWVMQVSYLFKVFIIQENIPHINNTIIIPSYVKLYLGFLLCGIPEVLTSSHS